MAHAYKKDLPEDQDRLNPLHDRACQYLAMMGRKCLHRFADSWVDPPSDLKFSTLAFRSDKRRCFWESQDGQRWYRWEDAVESEASKAARSKWDLDRESIRAPAWEEYNKTKSLLSNDQYNKFQAIMADWEKATPKPGVEYDWVIEEDSRDYSHFLPDQTVAVCEKEIFPAVRNYRSGRDEPGATIKGYLDVWIELDEQPLAIEVKSAPVPTSEILRQILFYRNAFVNHSGAAVHMAEVALLLVTLYPLEPSNLEMIKARGIDHLELSPDVVNAWWAEKNR